MPRLLRILISLSALLAFSPHGHAKGFPAQGRVFAGIVDSDPKEVNQVTTGLGFKEFKPTSKFGAEITFAVLRHVELGMRYSKVYMTNLEVNQTPNSNYRALLDQDAVLGIARFPFLKSKFVRLDVFGGFGGANTTLDFRSATQNGDFSKREGGDWFSTIYTTYGGSVGVGYKNFFFFVEGGFDANKVKSPRRTGNLTGSVNTIDLSGSYIAIGLMFDGVAVTRN